jgi:hypothetical protein
MPRHQASEESLKQGIAEIRKLAEAHESRVAKAAKLEQLAPLGFRDAEDGEAPDALWHPVLGPINHGSVRLENVLDLVYAAGMKRGADDLRAHLRALLDVPQAPRPE